MLAGSGARAQADSASSGKQYSKQLHMKGVIYIIYREYLQVRKKHHFTENKKAHRGFGPVLLKWHRPAWEAVWPLGSRGIMAGHVYREEVAKSTGTQKTGGWQDRPQSRGGNTRSLFKETKTRYVALSRQVSRTETLANKWQYSSQEDALSATWSLPW